MRPELSQTLWMLFCVLLSGQALAHDEFVVETSEKRPPSTASGTEISQADLTTNPMRSPDEVLRLVPGLTLSQHGSEGKGQQIFWRGFDAAHGTDIEVRWGHIPLNEASNIHGHGYLDLGFLTEEGLLGMRAEPGAFSIHQGSFANAGTIWLEPGAAGEERVTVGVGSTGRLELGILDTRDADFLALGVMADQGFGQNRSAHRASVLVGHELWRRDDLKIESKVAVYHAGFQNAGTLRADSIPAEIGFFDSYFTQGFDPGGMSQRAIVGLELTDRRWHVAAYAIGRTFEIEENFTGSLLEPEGDGRLQSERALTLGFDAHRRYILGRGWAVSGITQIDSSSIRQSETSQRLNGDLAAMTQDYDFQQSRGAMGVSVDGLLGDLRLDFGLRADLLKVDVESSRGSGTGTRAALSPRLRSQFFAGEHLTFFGAYGHGLRPPEARAFVPSEPTERVDQFVGGEPEFSLSQQAEVGIRLEEHVWGAQIAAFGILMDRESVYDHVSGLNVDLSATQRLGLESSVWWSPVTALRLKADIALVDARFKGSGNPVPGAPSVVANVRGTFSNHGWNASAHLMYIGPRPLAFGAVAGDSLIVMASGGYKWSRYRLGLEVQNLLNAEWRQGEYQFASKWSEETSQIPAIHVSAGPPLSVLGTLTILL